MSFELNKVASYKVAPKIDREASNCAILLI